MPRISAGLLMYRLRAEGPQVLLVHPGGPFWKNKDAGAWSIPKGEVEPGEELLATAIREFNEEIGFSPAGPFTPLSAVQQKGGKVVHAWATPGDFDTANVKCNTYKVQWPPGSGKWITCPEIDRAEFFALGEARAKINPAQAVLLDELAGTLERRSR